MEVAKIINENPDQHTLSEERLRKRTAQWAKDNPEHAHKLRKVNTENEDVSEDQKQNQATVVVASPRAPKTDCPASEGSAQHVNKTRAARPKEQASDKTAQHTQGLA